VARFLLIFLLQIFEKGFAFGAKLFFEAPGAIAIATGPWLGPIPIAAIAAGMSILDAKQLEIFLPILPLFGERRGAKTGLNPMRDAVLGDARLAHVVKIFVARDGALAERAGVNGGEQRLFLSGFQTGFDEITHENSIVQ